MCLEKYDQSDRDYLKECASSVIDVTHNPSIPIPESPIGVYHQVVV